MNVNELLDTIEDTLEESTSMPLSGGKRLVDVEKEVDLHHGGRQPGQTGPGRLHGVGVLIQRDQPPALCSIQPQGDLAGVARTARGAVQIGARRVDGQPFQAFVQQNRDMLK